MPNVLTNSCKLLYADDVKIYRNITSISDAVSLQNDLSALYDWCISHKLSLNAQKCSIISFTTRKSLLNFEYHINRTPLKRVETVTDLGVTIKSNMTFNEHIDRIVSEAYRNLGFITRVSKDFKSTTVFKTLYKTYVRSKLDYASIIWHPQTKRTSQQLEMIQSRFLRILIYRETEVYPKFDIYKNLVYNFSLVTLEERRNQQLLLCLYKILHNRINVEMSRLDICLHVPDARTRRRHFLFHLPPIKTKVSSISPIWRMCDLYNYLLSIDCNLDLFHMPLQGYKSVVKELCKVQV